MKVFFILLALVGSTLFSDVLPNAQFVTSQNKPLQFYDLKGNYLFVSFVYTRCPIAKMCPLTMTLNKQVWRKVKTALPKAKMKFLIVTLDPEVDSPGVLKSYAKKWKLNEADFILTTGSAQVLSDFASQFNVIGFTNPDGTVSHNLKSVLISPELSELKQYKENEWKAIDVVEELKKTVTHSSTESVLKVHR